MPLLRVDANGFWCEAGGFYIDPWNPVDRALITHGHADHARIGSRAYLCTASCAPILRLRLGPDCPVQTLRYGETLGLRDVQVSFHPAGHILGSAQIRVEHRGEVWVVSGDYKLAQDPTCAPFEPVRCHTFITEAKFGLPIYRWWSASEIAASIVEWWKSNQERGKCSVLLGQPLGKSQRVLAGLDLSIGPVFCHEAVERVNRVYRASGVPLPETRTAGEAPRSYDWARALVIAPPAEQGSIWMKRLGAVSTALASGWMRIRGARRRRSIDRGFILSDHADWPGLQTAIAETRADCVVVSHGYQAVLARWLREQGKETHTPETRFADQEKTEEPSGAAEEI